MQSEASFNLHGKKLFIGLPAYDAKVSVKLAIALSEFCVKAQQHGIQIQLLNVSGCSVVSRVRNIIADEFLRSNCDHLFMVDSDMTFNADDVLRLLSWSQNKNIVAGVGAARKKEKVYFSTLDQDEDGNILMDKMGLVKVQRVGTGFIMIQRQVFETLRDAHPEWKYMDQNSNKVLQSFFDFKSTPDGYVGEDYVFCDRAREHGFSVWVDPTIKLGHMGIHEYEGAFGEDFLYPLLKPIVEERQVANG
jgi:hypothetical protein